MASSGARFLMRTNITNIAKDETTNKLQVTMDVDGNASEIQEYDTVLYATGRTGKYKIQKAKERHANGAL